jgi:hypothetical protein
LILQNESHSVADKTGERRVVLNRQNAIDRIAGARRRRSYHDRCPIISSLQVSFHGSSANLVLRRAHCKVLDLKITAYRRSWAHRKGAVTPYLQIAAYLRTKEREVAAVLLYIAGDSSIGEYAVLAR